VSDESSNAGMELTQVGESIRCGRIRAIAPALYVELINDLVCDSVYEYLVLAVSYEVVEGRTFLFCSIDVLEKVLVGVYSLRQNGVVCFPQLAMVTSNADWSVSVEPG